MLAALARKGVPENRRIAFPNWLRGRRGDAAAPGAFRAVHGIAPTAWLGVYSGNLGMKQGADVLLQAAELVARLAVSNPAAARITLVIAGAGAGRESLARRIGELGLPNVRLLPLLPDAEYDSMLRDADFALVTQAAGTGKFFFPSKLLSVLDAGLPVITVADDDSELALAVAEGGFGLNVEPGRPDLLAAALLRASADPGLRADLAGRTPWVERFRPSLVLPRYLERLAAAAQEGDSGPLQAPSTP